VIEERRNHRKSLDYVGGMGNEYLLEHRIMKGKTAQRSWVKKGALRIVAGSERVKQKQVRIPSSTKRKISSNAESAW